MEIEIEKKRITKNKQNRTEDKEEEWCSFNMELRWSHHDEHQSRDNKLHNAVNASMHIINQILAILLYKTAGNMRRPNGVELFTMNASNQMKNDRK